MTVVKKVRHTEPLRSLPKASPPSPVMPSDGGLFLQVIAGEKVNTGAKPDVVEHVGAKTITWVWVEAISGQFVDERKGYIDSVLLGPEDEEVDQPDGFQPFAKQVEKKRFAEICYLQAVLAGTNPAYLYALAWMQSGHQWSDTHVQAADPDDAPAVGAFKFTKSAWESLRADPDARGITADEIVFPNVQCILAAILTAKSHSLLKGLITNRGVSAVDLYLAFLFAEDGTFGSASADKILQAEKQNKGQAAKAVIDQIFANDANKVAVFLQRTAAIFKADGSATIEAALKVCTDKLDAGFDKVREIAGEIAKTIPGGADGSLSGANFDGRIITVTDNDLEALARVAQSEVGHFGKYGQPMLIDAMAAVLDTIFNRVAFPKKFPKTIVGVINQKSAFSAIKAGKTWQSLPAAPPDHKKIVQDHVEGRAKGAASKIKGATHFLNPEVLQAVPNWAAYVVSHPTAIYGSQPGGGDLHYHGFPSADYGLPDDYAIRYGEDGFVFSGDGTPKFRLVELSDKRSAIVAAALKEWEFWGKSTPSNVAHTEHEEDYAKHVLDTYCPLVGAKPSLSNIMNEKWHWSAAAISYMLGQAGIEKSAFSFSASHSVYIREAIKAQKALDASKAFWGYRVDDDKAVPQPGDLIGYARPAKKDKPLSKEQVLAYFDKTTKYDSHTDIVVAVRPGEIDVIGGNVSDSVTKKTVGVDASGKITDKAHYCFVVMKLH